MTGIEVIKEIERITIANIDFVERKLKHLSEEQLNWKPANSVWSLNEIFAHLNSYIDFYNETISKKVEVTRFREPTMNFVSSPLGRAAWKSMKLGNAQNIKRKFNSPVNYNPSVQKHLVKGNDHQLFVEKENEFLAILEEAKKVNLRKVKVSISLSKIIKLRLGDALYFVTYHNERHVEQARKLMELPNFPKKK